MGDNVRAGGAHYEAGKVTDMRAYDRLPVTVRRAIRDAALPTAASDPDLWEWLRENGARQVAEAIRDQWPCGGIQGARIPLAPEDAEWLARATRTNHPATAEGGER